MPKLSVCMIVKDGRMCDLGRAVESLPAWTHELVLVDTGGRQAFVSTTLGPAYQLAESHAALRPDFPMRPGSFEWCDDFAAARNFALSKCSGDWVLSLDADDQLTPETCAWIRNAIQGEPKQYCPLYRNLGGVDAFVGPRLFWREGAVWKGRVHEIVQAEGEKVEDPNFIILHDGYDTGDQHAKHVRNYKLGALELADNPTAKNLVYFASEMMTVGKPGHLPAMLCDLAWNDIASAEGWYEVKTFALMAIVYLNSGRNDRCFDVLKLAIDRGGEALWVYDCMLKILLEDGQYQLVIEGARAAESMPNDHFGNRESQLTQIRKMRDAAVKALEAA